MAEYEDKSIQEWKAEMKDAQQRGTWSWKSPKVLNPSVPERVASAKPPSLVGQEQERFFASEEIRKKKGSNKTRVGKTLKSSNTANTSPCIWREVVARKTYHCHNSAVMRLDKASKGFCGWHQKLCLDCSRDIELTNAEGRCLPCFAKAHASEPPRHHRPHTRLAKLNIPGVFELNVSRMKHEMLLYAGLLEEEKVKDEEKSNSNAQPSLSRCKWKQHNDQHRLCACTNVVIVHVRSGASLPYCGYHVNSCIAQLPDQPKCPPLHQVNARGLCPRHFASVLALEQNKSDENPEPIFPSPFLAPGVRICAVRKKSGPVISKHPLAPGTNPSSSGKTIRPELSSRSSTTTSSKRRLQRGKTKTGKTKIKTGFSKFKTSESSEQPSKFLTLQAKPEVQSRMDRLLHALPIIAQIMKFQKDVEYRRKRERYAVRVQRLVRGRAHRRTLEKVRHEREALRRLKGILSIQTWIRRVLGQRAFAAEFHAVHHVAVPILQRNLRGFLARRVVR